MMAETRLQRISLEAAKERRESLVLCLHAVLRACGVAVEYDELACAAGTAFMSSFAADASADLQWNVYGRHAFLVDAARLYGLELRDLHPPSAAPAPPAPREFDWHFHDSYLPLIRTSLLRDEPVLAWMGWSAPDAAEWGVITGIEDDADRCVGVTRGGMMRLDRPPIQVYQMVACTPRQPNPDEVVETVLHHARMILSNTVPLEFGVTTGLAAVDAWRDLLSQPIEKDHRERVADDLFRTLNDVVLGRRAAARLFARLRKSVSPSVAQVLDEWLELFGLTAGGLAPVVNEDIVRESLASASALERLSPILDLWRTGEESMLEIVTADRR